MKIGLEIHIALPTKSKLFCSCSMSAEKPNTAICPICLGFPGSKPMLNKEAVKRALDIVNALHCKTNKKMSFVRKVYFYPDLPKSYQITQLEGSIGGEGYLAYEKKKVRIRRVQLEEDPAKIVREGALTLLDFNRSGTPLVEIVTEPDITSEDELWGFLRTLRSILYYLNIDIDKEMKADLNISVAEIRVEVKNVTGIKNLIEAAKYEIERQELLVKEGEKIARETRGYDEKKKSTESMREKETDEEYGYLFEPDLTIFDISNIPHMEAVYIDEVVSELAKKYKAKEKTLMELTMFDSHALDLVDKFKEKYKMQSIIHAIARTKKYEKESMSDTAFESLIKLIDKDVLITKEVINEVAKGREVKEKHEKLTDEELDKLILDYLKSNKQVLEDYKTQKKVLNLIIGEVSQKGNLHPKDVAKRVIALIKKIEEGKIKVA